MKKIKEDTSTVRVNAQSSGSISPLKIALKVRLGSGKSYLVYVNEESTTVLDKGLKLLTITRENSRSHSSTYSENTELTEISPSLGIIESKIGACKVSFSQRESSVYEKDGTRVGFYSAYFQQGFFDSRLSLEDVIHCIASTFYFPNSKEYKNVDSL